MGCEVCGVIDQREKISHNEVQEGYLIHADAYRVRVHFAPLKAAAKQQYPQSTISVDNIVCKSFRR